MRLWHKSLINVLPDKQLLGQWRELCLIARSLHEGKLNHLLVNKVKGYPLSHLNYYGQLVQLEMTHRGIRYHDECFDKWLRDESTPPKLPYPYPEYDELFKDWHNDRYLRQCYYNLQEKFDCGGISEEEWLRIEIAYQKHRTSVLTADFDNFLS